MRKKPDRRIAALLAVALALAAGGCASLGSKAIPRDRVNYQEALANSWKTQTLLNLVRIRYADPPVFLEVASIVNSYSWEAGASVGAGFSSVVDQQNLGAHGTYIDRPTVTYSPLSGEKFTKSIITPLEPVAILSLIQSGYPVEAVFRLCVKSINGISNQSGALALRRVADPSFLPLLQALGRIQARGAVGLRLEKKDAGENVIVVLHSGRASDLERDQQFVRETLGLNDSGEYRLTFCMLPSDDGEVALLTRSMMEIMGEISSGIEVPAKDIEEQRVLPPMFGGAPEEVLPPPLRVHVSAELPDDAFAAARYRDQWFWIDDRDIPSKKAFGFLMLLFSLAESGGHSNMPVLTIPAG